MSVSSSRGGRIRGRRIPRRPALRPLCAPRRRRSPGRLRVGGGQCPVGSEPHGVERLRSERSASVERSARARQRNGDEPVDAQRPREHALRRRLRTEHRRALGGPEPRAADRLVLLRQRRSRLPRGRPTPSCTRAIASGGICTTGVRPRTCPLWWAPSPSPSCTAPVASGCRCAWSAPWYRGTHAARSLQRLRALGVPAAISTVEPGDAPDTLRVLVGPWTAVASDPAALSVGRGPGASGVYVRISDDGRTLSVLDADGHTARTLTAGAGLIAATRYAEGGPVWVITGTDAAGVSAAADAFDESNSSQSLRRGPLGAGRDAGGAPAEPMNRALFYRRLPSPLHAARASVGALWATALSAAALLLFHPVALAVLALAVLGAGVGAGVGSELTTCATHRNVRGAADRSHQRARDARRPHGVRAPGRPRALRAGQPHRRGAGVRRGDRAEADRADPDHHARQPRHRSRRAAEDAAASLLPLSADRVAGNAYGASAGRGRAATCGGPAHPARRRDGRRARTGEAAGGSTRRITGSGDGRCRDA